MLACELGPHGLRVVTLESGGVIEAVPEDSEGRDTIIERIVAATMLGAGGDVRRRVNASAQPGWTSAPARDDQQSYGGRS